MTQVQTNPNVLTNAPCHATVPCTDINAAKDFYQNTLGLNVINTSSGDGGVVFSAGEGTQIHVFPRNEPPKAENTCLSFTVSDVAGTVEVLRGNGVTFLEYDTPDLKTENGIATMGDLQAAWFNDPDGNILAISNM